MLLVCLGIGSVMKTRPVWEQGESTQLLVVSNGSRLGGYYDCCRLIFSGCRFHCLPYNSIKSNSLLFQFRCIQNPTLFIYLLWQWMPRCLNPLLYECAVLVSSALAILLWLFMPQECTMWVIPCQVNQIFSTFEPDPLGFFSNLAHHMYHRR